MCYENKVKEDGDSRNNFPVTFLKNIRIFKKSDHWPLNFNTAPPFSLNIIITVLIPIEERSNLVLGL